MYSYERIFIDGQWVAPTHLEIMRVTNPVNGELVGQVPNCGTSDVDLAVAAARRAFGTWSEVSIGDRVAFLRRLNEVVSANKNDLARMIHLEMGSPMDFALSEHVGAPIAIIDSVADLLPNQRLEERLGNSLIVREPIGVVAAITPWNYPLYQMVAKAIPAIAAGCTVVVKPSELTPLSTFRFVELMEEAGLPAGVINLVPGTGSIVGEAMSAHIDVDMVSFTGSTRAGRRVAAAAAETVKRVALELGGKSASVVLEGADLRIAVRESVRASTTNAGQSCDAWSRLVVPRSLAAQVEEIAIVAAAELDGTLGPAVSQQQFEQVQNYIRVGEAEGARRIAGGAGNPEGLGPLHNRVTVFADVTTDMRIAQEEIFGPVLTILLYDTIDEAAEIANSTVYGLHGGVWAETNDEALAFARRMRTGQVSVNGGDANINAPFGGYRQSGIGRELGPIGVEEFYEVKAIQLPTSRSSDCS